MSVLKNSLGQSHDIIKSVVTPGDSVIDATAGNGNDTAFLAGLVGTSGRVYSFDIQQKALDKTKAKLECINLLDRVTLIHDGHENMDLYVKERVKAVMFNLGYLPGGDHSIGTKGRTTIEALEKAMGLIADDGIITVVIYYGGDSGFEEKNQVMDYLKTIDCKRFTVMMSNFINQVNCPPILICIENNL